MSRPWPARPWYPAAPEAIKAPAVDREQVRWWSQFHDQVEAHPEWAAEPLARGPTPISKRWKESL